MTHSGEMSLTEEEGLCRERRWLVFFVNLTKLHSFSGYLSPEVGRAGFAEDVKYAIGFQRKSLSGWTPEENGTFPEKKQLCLQPAASACA